MTLTISTRELRLEVAYNVRHIGGYAGSAGPTPENIVRSAGLQRLTERGLAALADAGITTIIDLRSSGERKENTTPDTAQYGITDIHNPIWETNLSPEALGQDFQGYAPVYRWLLESGAPAYRRLFEAIAASKAGILFHCAAGKDRTGVAAALLLSLAGVPEGDILEDYAISEVLLQPAFAQWVPRMQERGINEEKARALMASTPAAMVETFEFIHTQYGSAEGYMRESGMSPAAIAELRARLAA